MAAVHLYALVAPDASVDRYGSAVQASLPMGYMLSTARTMPKIFFCLDLATCQRDTRRESPVSVRNMSEHADLGVRRFFVLTPNANSDNEESHGTFTLLEMKVDVKYSSGMGAEGSSINNMIQPVTGSLKCFNVTSPWMLVRCCYSMRLRLRSFTYSPNRGCGITLECRLLQ